MNVIAMIPTGLDEMTVNGLTQWDYGRTLEIHSEDLPALIEVHFACAGMESAIVRPCTVIQGVAQAVIPDQCLEQSGPVTAWVVWLDETSGKTYKTITLPITPRTRPQPTASIPTTVSDRYTELIGEVNQQIDTLKAGDVKVASAFNADKATRATNSDQAKSAISSGTANALNLTFTNVGADHYSIADSGLYLVDIGLGIPAYKTFTSFLLIRDYGLPSIGTSAKADLGGGYFINVWAEFSDGLIFVKTDSTTEGLQILGVAHISY